MTSGTDRVPFLGQARVYNESVKGMTPGELLCSRHGRRKGTDMKEARENFYKALASAAVFVGGVTLTWGLLIGVDRLMSLLGI